MLNERLQQLSDYPFQRLTALLAGTRPPEGTTTVSLALGEPQHAPPALIGRILAEGGADWGKYPPVQGSPDFRAAVAAWLNRRYDLPRGLLEPERMILPALGTREALFLVAQLAVNGHGGGADAPLVLMPNPFYQVYLGGAVMSGARPVLLPATRETGFLPDLAAVDRATWERTALVYLCTPGNPQGAVMTLDAIKDAITLARRHNFVLVVDECYAEIYDREPPPGALQACAELGEGFANVLVFHSLSKRSSAAGLRSGFVAGDPRLIEAFARLRSYGGATMPLPVCAASAALWQDEAHVVENRALYRAKLDAAERHLAGRFGFYRPQGGFFLWLDVGDGEAAAVKLWGEAGLRVLPGAYLARGDARGGNPGQAYIRVALVHDLATTEAALAQIARVL